MRQRRKPRPSRWEVHAHFLTKTQNISSSLTFSECLPLQVRFARPESEQARQRRIQSYEFLQKKQAEEPWVQLHYHGVKVGGALIYGALGHLFCNIWADVRSVSKRDNVSAWMRSYFSSVDCVFYCSCCVSPVVSFQDSRSEHEKQYLFCQSADASENSELVKTPKWVRPNGITLPSLI